MHIIEKTNILRHGWPPNSNCGITYLNEPFHPRIRILNIFEAIVFFENLIKIRVSLYEKAHTH